MRIVNLVSINASCAYGIISMWWLTLAASIWSPPCYYFISLFSLWLLFAAAVPVNISEIHLHRSFFSVISAQFFFRLFHFFSFHILFLFFSFRIGSSVRLNVPNFFLFCLSFVCFEPREKEKKCFIFIIAGYFFIDFFVCVSQGRWNLLLFIVGYWLSMALISSAFDNENVSCVATLSLFVWNASKKEMCEWQKATAASQSSDSKRITEFVIWETANLCRSWWRYVGFLLCQYSIGKMKCEINLL